MVTLYTSTGEYVMRRNANGIKFPVVMMAGREYRLSVPEMILWTKGMWNICSHDLLREAFQKEEQVLGEMNFNFVLNRLTQRGLIISAEADSDLEALNTLLGNLIVNAADVSVFSQVKVFLLMVFMMKMPIKLAKAVFKKYDLTAEERLALSLANDKHITASELIYSLNMDNTAALIMISNLYLKKLVRFSENKAVESL